MINAVIWHIQTSCDPQCDAAVAAINARHSLSGWLYEPYDISPSLLVTAQPLLTLTNIAFLLVMSSHLLTCVSPGTNQFVKIKELHAMLHAIFKWHYFTTFSSITESVVTESDVTQIIYQAPVKSCLLDLIQIKHLITHPWSTYPYNCTLFLNKWKNP